MAMSGMRRRQLGTSVLLALLIAACILGGLYLRRERRARALAEDARQAAQEDGAREQERENARLRYAAHTPEQRARTVTDAQGCPQRVALLVTGTCGSEEAAALAQELRACGIQAAFFLTREELETHGEMAAALSDGGFGVGVLLEETAAQPEEMAAALADAAAAMQAACGVRPTALLARQTPGDAAAYAALAASFEEICVPAQAAEADDYATPERAQALVDGLERGTLLAVRIGEGRAQALVPLAQALQATDLGAQAEALLAQAGQLDPPGAVRAIRTVAREVSFVFSGMGSDAELGGVLDALAGAQGTGIFFLTGEQLAQCDAQARRILSGGHRLGLAVSGEGAQRDALIELLAGEELLRGRYGVQEKPPVLCAQGEPGGALLAAAAAGGFTVLGWDVQLTRMEDAWRTDAAAIIGEALPATRGALRRGEIAAFRLGVYQNGDAVLGEVVAQVAAQRNIYAIRPATDILAEAAQRYEYPVPRERVLPEVLDQIHPGQLEDASFETLCSRYIGISWVKGEDYLPGFAPEEIRRLDRKGVIPDAKGEVFLTFDDWGTDAAVTRLLDVLRAHGVKATFFIRTNYVESNPNLVRAIAAEGHAIGSHTDTHFPLANLEDDGRYTELTAEQGEALREDVTRSYQRLQRIVGDVEADGRPCLCRVFRPPTLAMSRTGLEAVLDCGFTVSLSGSYTAQDYEADDARSLFTALRRNTRDGAVLILHMSDSCAYTAEALDLYLTYMEKYAPEYRFRRVTDAL